MINPRLQVFINALADSISLRATGQRDTKHTQAWDDYGYKINLEFNDHFQMQRRFGIARAGIRVPVENCWKEIPKIHQGDLQDGESRRYETQWEKQVSKVFKKSSLWRKLRIADEYQRVGHYGAFIVQVRGAQYDWSMPLGSISDRDIVKFIPVYEDQLKPESWENDDRSERYGQPLTYRFQESELIDDIEQDNRNRAVTVHHSRVIIFAEGADDDSIYGVPANEAGFNDLVTMEKIIGAGGEGFWKSAAMKTVFTDKIKDGQAPTADEIDDMDEAISDFVKGLDKHLMAGNLDPKVLSVAMADPKEHFMIALQSYSASIGVASKLLVGSQEGRLAADQDGKFTLSAFQSRCENWCSQMICSVIDWMMAHRVIEQTDYTIEWPDLLAPSDSDKLTIAEKMANINQKMLAVGEAPFTSDEIRIASGYQELDPELDMSADESIEE